MMMTSGGGVHYKSMFDAGSQIIAKEGTKSLFKGAGANILRGVAGAGVLSLYDKAQEIMFGKVYSGGTYIAFFSDIIVSYDFKDLVDWLHDLSLSVLLVVEVSFIDFCRFIQHILRYFFVVLFPSLYTLGVVLRVHTCNKKFIDQRFHNSSELHNMALSLIFDRHTKWSLRIHFYRPQVSCVVGGMQESMSTRGPFKNF